MIGVLALVLPRRREGPVTPPDLEAMTPRERFDRLYNRIMTAAESGNPAEVSRFAPMAFAAYAGLDRVDADARYHVAVLYLHATGDIPAALAQADSITAESPRHLFAILIRGTAARQSGDSGLLARSEHDLLQAWDDEMAVNRPEYRDHRVMLDRFRAGALRSREALR